MKITERLLKPLIEVNYLRAENVERYRSIIRFFYLEYEKRHYWIHREDVFETLKATGYFDNYTIEECQNDLTQLTSWGNLLARQDSSKVNTLEEFKNRKYRYQLSDYTVEIERMAMRLETLEIEGASLEPTLLERIHQQILKIKEMASKEDDEVSGWWNDLNNDFIRLNRNYQDYIRTLNSAKAEELMKTEAFLVFKEKILQYLRTFVKGLQEQSLVLEYYMSQLDPKLIEIIIQKIIRYEMSIPRIDRVFNEEEFYEICMGRWMSIYNWFVGDEESEVSQISESTMDIIRKITRAAQHIGEQLNVGANKKEEYRHIAHIFSKCKDINEAHKMSAMVFGVGTCLHLKDLDTRVTDSINSGVYQEEPTHYSLEPRTRIARVKVKREAPVDFAIEKEMYRLEQLEKLDKQKKMIEKYIVDQVIDFSKIEMLETEARKMFLNWISRALSNINKRGRNEWGDYYTVDNSRKELYKVTCEDGDLYIPGFKIYFEKGASS